MHVVIIDDEVYLMQSIAIFFERDGHKVAAQEGGVAGLDYVTTHADDIDVVLLDLMMPDMHGLDVLRAMKENPATASIPVLIQTGAGSINEVDTAMELGAIEVLHKPLKPHTLITKVTEVARKKDV